MEKRMNLVYIDESGNTGLNLKDQQQPIFLMAALIIHSQKWFAIEKAFYQIFTSYFPPEVVFNIELHAADLKSRRKSFDTISQATSLEIRNRMFSMLLEFNIPVVYQRIIKTNFENFCLKSYGPGIKVDPYIMALPFICMSVNSYLQEKDPHELGMFIFDEQQSYFADAERSLHSLRLDSNSILKTTNIIERGFFVNSQKSFGIQLTDLVAHYLRKREEFEAGLPVSPFDQQTFPFLKKIVVSSSKMKTSDILVWVRSNFANQKNERLPLTGESSKDGY